MLKTKCVGDIYKMLVTVLAISVTAILYLSAHSKDVTNMEIHLQIVANFKSPTSLSPNVHGRKIVIDNLEPFLIFQFHPFLLTSSQ